MSSLNISVKNEPTTLQSEYSVGIGQPTMALGTRSWQYNQLVADAGVCSTWRDMVNRANANNQRNRNPRRYSVQTSFNPFNPWSKVDIGFYANF
ncbi:MAG: hypothetical protein EAZ87_06810 [Nostocales cyanobacterium]|nr:MAG: hypothetical protein EAZ87_06810 [Nostocales cyanobacterium]